MRDRCHFPQQRRRLVCEDLWICLVYRETQKAFAEVVMQRGTPHCNRGLSLSPSIYACNRGCSGA